MTGLASEKTAWCSVKGKVDHSVDCWVTFTGHPMQTLWAGHRPVARSEDQLKALIYDNPGMSLNNQLRFSRIVYFNFQAL